eukprot:TRINITY_DN219_c0_g1_i1.p2 TRINITY_DN219_c0_g1~~TRINITY_DN219_c0_g1_i1.p2  ORF type:complete len:417 (-),score=39.20 TRINITY_DN219_c0_g1_i1:1771-3021(-)
MSTLFFPTIALEILRQLPTQQLQAAKTRSSSALLSASRSYNLTDHAAKMRRVKCLKSTARKTFGSSSQQHQIKVFLSESQNRLIGKGIEIFKNDIGGIRKFLQSKPMGTTWVIQKYIERPLLYKGRKFDIRMWAIITWKAELYYYKMGYIRTSSYEYSLENSANYVHLTNNCLQQHGKEYGKFEDGNTVSFHDFTKFLQVNYPFVDFEKDIIGRIKDIMIDTFLATKDSLNPSKRRNCFEFLGYDFLIDEDFHVWLLEVNTNPYLGVPNKYIEGLLPKMINDMLEIVLDLYMLPANKLPERQILNQFELLYEERSGINQRRSYATSLYPGGETQREPVVKKLCKRPSLEHVLKEVKPESNAIESIISLCETNEDTFVKSPIFSALARKALSAKSDMSDTFRKYVVVYLYVYHNRWA